MQVSRSARKNRGRFSFSRGCAGEGRERLAGNLGEADDVAAIVKRNREMAQYADALIAIWDGDSRGTGSMIKLAQQHGLKVYVFTVR